MQNKSQKRFTEKLYAGNLLGDDQKHTAQQPHQPDEFSYLTISHGTLGWAEPSLVALSEFHAGKSSLDDEARAPTPTAAPEHK